MNSNLCSLTLAGFQNTNMARYGDRQPARGGGLSASEFLADRVYNLQRRPHWPEKRGFDLAGISGD